MMMSSHDGGLNWGRPQRLPPGVLGPVKDKPIQLSDGSILCGSSTEDSVQGWQVHVESTSDLGRTWKIVGPINRSGEFNAIQPTLLINPDGRLQLLCRTKEMIVATAWSSDRGASWTRLAPSGLYAPNSGIDAVTLSDGRQLLVYNFRSGPRTGPPAPNTAFRLSRHGEDWGARWPLNLALSRDGLHWTQGLTLEDQPRPNGYAYPAVIQTRDGLVHITYTWNRQRIKHVVLDPRML
jgi:predicted neuraminidase